MRSREGFPAGSPSVDPPGPTRGELAYILAEFPSLSETFILREIDDLLGRGMPVRLYALRASGTARVHADAARLMERVTYRARPGSAKCLRAHWRALRYRTRPYLGLLASALWESRGCPRRLRNRLIAVDAAVGFAEALAANGTRHLHAHFADLPTTIARYAGRLLGVSYSLSAHARDIYVGERQDRAGLEVNLRRAAFAVTCTEFNRRHLLEQFPALRADRLFRVYHGIDVARFADTPARKRPGPPHILAVGRLQRKKGLHLLVEACGMLKRRGREFLLVLAGDGPERGPLAALAEQQGITGSVLFLGELTLEELQPVYRDADLFALPCIIERGGDRDGLPNVLLEALAAGLGVISTPVSGIPEVIEEGVTGLLVPPDDAAALADALERLLADPELGRRLGQAGRERVRREFDLRHSPLAELFAREAGIRPTAEPALKHT